MYGISDFINNANKKHNGKYNYSLVNYVNMKTNVDIMCVEHGVFSQNPATHLSRSGCPSCAGVKRYTKEEFILRVNKIHNFKYDYSLIDYTSNQKKIKIKCLDHDIFEQTPQNHISGRGCPSCVGVKKLTKDIFISNSIKIHGTKYDYSLVEFDNNDSQIKIICPIHGSFTQRCASHMSGCGCKSCAMECKTSKIETKWLDEIGISDSYRQYKIDKYIVDGYDPIRNIIYEFNGDFWHGNPNVFSPNDTNTMLKKSFGKLYENTLNKEKHLISLGYNVVSIWESDYKKSNQLIKS